MATHFVTIYTNTISDDRYSHKEPRNVTLAYNRKEGIVYLLGNLEHNTQIVVDQELVNNLQFIVDEMKKENGE